MSNYLSAAQDIQALSLQYQRVIDLGAFLGKLGSMENLEGEIQARIDAAKAAEVAACNALQVKQEECSHAADELDQKRAWRDSTIADAQAERARIVQLAKDDAAQIIDEAKHAAEAIAEHAAKVKAEAVQLEADIAAKVEEHTQWKEKIESLKTHVSDFIKG